jgi:hypothetical protein
MGGSKKVSYKAPNIPKDTTFQKYLNYQQQKETSAAERAAQEKADQQAAQDSLNASGASGYAGFNKNVEQQLRQGLINFDQATQQLRDYTTKYNMGPREGDVSRLTNVYTKELLPGRRTTGTNAAYEEILGRAPTAQEQETAMARFNQGYYTSNEDLRNSLYKSTEYNDKFNQSYLDNYYDTTFGKQTTDTKGKKTGQRTFKFSSDLLPQMAEGTTERTGVVTPKFNDFTGTPGEIEEQLQNIRDTRQYLYSAGLTNLQGEIDKETQKLKNEGQKEIANITSFGNVASNLVSGFWG